MKSKTQQALDWIAANPQKNTVPLAAEKFSISPQAIYKAQRDRRGKPICPCCGQVVRKGFKVKIPGSK